MQGNEEISAVPDGCIDLVFEYGGGIMNARACGTVLACQKTMFQFGHTYFGVRFLPGVRPCILDVSPRELVSCEADLSEITTCRDFLERMEEQTTFEGCVHTFLEEYGGYDSAEAALDGVVSVVVALYQTCQRETFPSWARCLMQEIDTTFPGKIECLEGYL